MASSLLSLDLVASPTKFESSRIHLCMSVKRTVSGSVSGCASVRPIAMSSMSSQSNVGGTVMAPMWLLLRSGYGCKAASSRRTPKLVIEFFGVIFIPLGNFHHDIRRTVGYGLAAEAGLWRNAWGHIQFIQLRIRRFVAGFQTLAHD